MSKEFNIGLLVVTVVVVFTIFGLQRESKRPDPFSPRYVLLFTQVAGLREGDKAKVSGVTKGYVEDIDFASPAEQAQFKNEQGTPPMVRVTVVMNSRMGLARDCTYRVHSNLKGYRWVEITPGFSREVVRPGQPFMAEQEATRDDRLTRTLSALKKLSRETEDLRNLASDPDFRRQVKDSASNMRFYSREFQRTSLSARDQVKDLDKLIDSNEKRFSDQLKRIDAQVDQVERRLVTLSPQVKETLDQYRARIHSSNNEIKRLLADARRYSDEFEKVVKELSKRYEDSPIPEDLARQVREYSRKIEDISLLAEDMHTLSSDPQIQGDLRKMISDLREKAENLRREVERWEEAVDGLGL